MVDLMKRRFEDSLDQVGAVNATESMEGSGMSDFPSVDRDMLLNWTVKAKNLLEKVCGATSQHMKHYEQEEAQYNYRINWQILMTLTAILDAAQEDYLGGYLQPRNH